MLEEMSRRPLVMLTLVVGMMAAANAAPPSAQACSISPEPSAWIQQPTTGGPTGRRPWIVLWRATGKVRLTGVAASCSTGVVCKGTPVPFDRFGGFIRPTAPLPKADRLQVTMGGRLLAEASMQPATSKPLPEWNGVEWVSAGNDTAGLCSPEGPTVRLRVRPTDQNLDGAVLLVWLRKPNPAAPARGLTQVLAVGTGPDLRVGNQLGARPILRNIPRRLWVAIADAEGNVGTPMLVP